MMNPAIIAVLEDKTVDHTQFLERLARCMEMKIPASLSDNLIGESIRGTSYFRIIPGDPTKGLSGWMKNETGKRVYQIEHQPTGSNTRYRKLNHAIYGECWEAIQD